MATFLKRLSLRTRLTTLFVLIFGVSTIIFSVILYYLLNDSLLQDFDNALYNYAVDVSRNIDIGTKNDLLFPPLKVDEGKIFPFPSGTALIQVRHLSGKVLIQSGDFGTFKFPYKKDIDAIKTGADSYYRTLDRLEGIPEAEAESYRLITFPLDSVSTPTLFLQIAVPMTTFETQLDRFTTIVTFGLPALLIISVVLGWYFASRALRPVQNIIQKTKQIDANNLSQRLPLPAANDEIRTLAETQNQLLERMQKYFVAQERFIADASHQLLTPLTILRGEIEIQLTTQKLDSQFLPSALQEVDALTKIVKDMLLLARIDSGSDAMNVASVNLDEIILDVVSRLQKIAHKKNVNIKFDIQDLHGRPEVLGDENLLTNLVYNLIENAIKYSPENESVLINLIWLTDETVVEVCDFGPGIPEELKESVFERFRRLNPSGKTIGFGLGLSIAKKIANLHNAELHIEKNTDSKHPTGTKFSFKIKNQLKHV